MYMKAKTQRRRKTGGYNMKLLVTLNVSRTPQFAGGYGGVLRGEIYTNEKGDVKIQVYASDSQKPRELLLKSVGMLPENMIGLYKIAIEDGRAYPDIGIDTMMKTIEKITRIIATSKADLEQCEQKKAENRELGNENIALIDKIARISREFNE